MKKPVIVALCCLLALSTGTAAFAEEKTVEEQEEDGFGMSLSM